MGCGCRFLIFGLVFLGLGLIGMLCLTAGWINNSNLNDALTFTDKAVTVTSQSWATTCSYCCSNSDGCDTCYRTCFYGVISLEIPNVTTPFTIDLQVVSGITERNDVDVFLSTNFPIGKTFKCYYSGRGQSTHVQLQPNDSETSKIVGIVFCSFAAAVLVVWLIVEAIICMPDCLGSVSQCCSDCSIRRERSKRERDRIANDKRVAKEQREMEEQRQAEEARRNSYKATPEDFLPPDYTQPPATAPPLSFSQTQKLY